MALVLTRGTRDVLEDPRAIEAFLGENDIRYARWGVEPGPLELVLDLHAGRIDEEKRAHGYVAADVVALSPVTPRLDEICAKFDKEHTHDDDEVRFVVSGHGTFTIRSRSGEAIDVVLGPGDFISIPRDRRHWFTLLADRSVVAVRLFKDAGGWTPRYAGDGTGPTEIPGEILARAFGVL